jgi:putative ABC transport system ATP-binding protein
MRSGPRAGTPEDALKTWGLSGEAPAHAAALVELRAVKVVYPDGTAGLSDADFRLNAGELVVVSGPSGAGKSTLLATMSGRLPASAGCVLLGGAAAASMGSAELVAWRRSTAFVAQGAPMLERRTVAENVAYALEIARPDVHDAGSVALEALDALGIGETGDRRPSELSGGQRQRAALAQALAKSPVALFVDEPTANLDPRTAAQVVAVIASHCQDRMACVAASHHDAQFASSAARRLWMCDGRLGAVPSRPYETLTDVGP